MSPREPAGKAGPRTGAHEALLEALGLSAAQRRALGQYLDLLAAWGSRMNLTGASTPRERVALLVAEVLPAAPVPEPGLLIDVGSGNGSPGLVLAVLRPELPVVLLEPRSRRWAFLREAARAVGRSDIRVLKARHHDYRGRVGQTLTMRGLSLPPSELARMISPGGRLLIFGEAPDPGGPFDAEGTLPLQRTRLHLFRRRFT